jgi:hypothetical protein
MHGIAANEVQVRRRSDGAAADQVTVKERWSTGGSEVNWHQLVDVVSGDDRTTLEWLVFKPWMSGLIGRVFMMWPLRLLVRWKRKWFFKGKMTFKGCYPVACHREGDVSVNGADIEIRELRIHTDE